MSYTKTTWVDNTTPINETNLNKIESGIKNNDINIGEENYDNTKTYEVGDIVRYNEKIYKCITAITTAENFDISKWEQTNIVEIVQSEKSKIYELIEAISTPIVGEGENITLNDTAEKRFENFDIEGNSKQEARSGKNKLNFSGLTSRTINGLTITNNKDGSITLNGTTTATVSMLLSNNMYNLVAGKYYLSRNSIGTVSGTFTNILYGKNETAVNIGGLTSEGMIITATTDYQEYYLWLYVTSGITFTNYTMKPQLETGTVKTDWELYGASPSPDYPSEVECCGDNINIFDGEVEEGNIDASTGQNAVTTNAWRSKNYLNVKDTSVSISIKDLTFSGTVGRLYFYKSDNTYISNILINSLPFTATLPNETAKVRFFILNSVADINSKIKVENGKVTEYSKTGQGCINEVICNKNLVVEIQKGYWNNTGVFDSDNNFCSSKQIKVEPGKTYVGSLFDKNKKYVGKLVYTVFDKNKNFIRHSGEDTITIANNEKYVSLRTYTSQASYVKNNNLLMQLEEGSTEKPYVEHQEQVFTIPTQQEMLEEDYFDTKNYKEVHNWKKIVLNGSETYTAGGSSNEVYRYDAQILINSAKVDKNKMVCTHFKSVYQDLNFYEHIRNSTKENPTAIVFYIKGKKTLTEFKAWLRQQYEAGTPITIYYKLETPEQIEMTLEQKRVLDKIEKAKSYKGVTHIYSNDEVSPNCYVEAVKDLTTLIQ